MLETVKLRLQGKFKIATLFFPNRFNLPASRGFTSRRSEIQYDET